jgi:dTDP-glucose 4,6-dehydratase
MTTWQAHPNPVIARDMIEIQAAALPWHRLAGKRVLVSGAGGLIGGYIVWALLHLGTVLPEPVSVIALGRDARQMRLKFGDFETLTFVEANLGAPEALDIPADWVIHAASNSKTSLHKTYPLETFAANIFGTQAMLNNARRSGFEGFLFVSSCAVYGQPSGADSLLISEDTVGAYSHLSTAMSYAEGKRAGEALCHFLAHEQGLPVTIARLGHTYGPGISHDDERIYADFAFKVFNGETLTIKSSGTAVRPFCYLTDAIAGLFTILFNGAPGAAYNLVNAKAEHTILGLAEELRAEYVEKNVKIEVLNQNSHSFQTSVHFSTAKLNALGWEPLVPVREGFRRTVSSLAAPASSAM